jgi:hypothetical protein
MVNAVTEIIAAPSNSHIDLHCVGKTQEFLTLNSRHIQQTARFAVSTISPMGRNHSPIMWGGGGGLGNGNIRGRISTETHSHPTIRELQSKKEPLCLKGLANIHQL